MLRVCYLPRLAQPASKPQLSTCASCFHQQECQVTLFGLQTHQIDCQLLQFCEDTSSCELTSGAVFTTM